jgi:protein TonB
LQRKLKDRARNTRYQAVLHIWISPQGGISRVELGKSSGVEEIDEALKAAIGTMQGQLDPPPERMPQPVKIRVQSEG